MHFKQQDGTISTKRVVRSNNQSRTTFTHRNQADEIISIEEDPTDKYDPRIRPWYIGAAKTRTNFWTDVYIFFTDQKPGVTAAMPVIDDNDQLLGVLGADIELDQLSHFLRNLTIGRNGRALIIDGQGRLVAYPQAKQMLRREGDKVQPVTLDELGDSVLSRAYNRFKIEGHGHRILSVDNQRYLNSVSSLRSTVVRDWSVMIVVPAVVLSGSS